MSRVIIDVREPDEFIAGHIDSAINIPPDELLAGSKQLADLPKNTDLILYCRTGSRSEVVKNILSQLGYTNIINGTKKERVEARLKLSKEHL